MPEIGDEDVLLEVAAVGVCGSDLHMWTGDHSWNVNYPCVLGHEFAGHVRKTGVRVANFKTGERVVSERWGEGTVQRYDGDQLTVLLDEHGYRDLLVPLVVERRLLRRA